MSLKSNLLLALVFSHVVFAALPNVDFDRMGNVGLAGAFAGVGFFNSSVSPFDPTTATLLSRNPAGAFSRLGSTNPSGAITSGCALKNVYYFGGSFTSIGGTSAANIASYTTSSGTFAALGSGGPNGEVDAIYCDGKANKVWVGGRFTSPGPSVAVWDVSSSSWSKAPFGGLAGAGAQVTSITSNSSGSSIFLAGSFITSFTGGPVSTGANNPNVPFSAGATPFSSSLVPIPLQSAEVTGSPSSNDPQFNDIKTILCPSGPDGPGYTWLAEDGNTAVITARTFSFMSGSGIRLGNTFVNGHGTTGFSVTTIPDNAVQTLHYFDPTTGQNQTCSDPCPLLTDSSILYQDFLFNSALSITGVQVTLSKYTGSGPGLHIFQILSSGAFASSLDQDNTASCFAPNPSNTTRTGVWTEKVADTNIPGTVQTVLVSTVDVGTPASQAPSFTWIPYVSATGDYDINLLVPGCTNFQDCAQRTSVKVTVFPGQGLQPWVSTISQQNTDDVVSLVYSGPINPSSPNFVTTVAMTLADTPAGTGQGGTYELVADRVQLVLKSAATNSSSGPGTGGSGTQAGSQNGFGFFEWPLSSSGGPVDATQTVSNSSETFFDRIGFELFQGLGGSSSLGSTSVRAVVHHPSGAIFIGGRFQLSTGQSNIAVFKDGYLASLAQNGLDGPVSSMVLDGDRLFVGGSFHDTASASTHGQLSGIAMYDVKQDQWVALHGGVNGAVASLAYSNGQVQIVGTFTKAIAATDTASDAAGFATWDVNNGDWANGGGFLVGNMTFVGNGTSSGGMQSQFIAGSVSAALEYGGTGLVMLHNEKDGPGVTPLGVQLDSDVSGGAAAPANVRRHLARSSWIPDLFKRQSTSPPPPLPPALPAVAPAVLAGAFWTNSSTSHEVVVIGGNFSFVSGSTIAQGIGIYDPKTTTITALQGAQVDGVVRALLVVNSKLYVGGQFALEGTTVNAFAVYDLAAQQWDLSSLSPLSSASGSPTVVRSVTTSSSKSNTVIVAGSFSQAGAVQCQSICAFDTHSKQWSALGSGVVGDVAAVAYAGSNEEVLVASGALGLPGDGGAANVVKYSFSNGTWSAVGSGSDLPGPVTAVEVNGGNSSSIFAAGRSTDGSSFLSFWDGVGWKQLSSLQGSSDIAQLVMVPLQDTHSSNGIIEPDRMLMVSGSLSDSSFGSASSALFDGQNLIPYITSMSPSGVAGSVSALFHSFSNFSFSQRRFLATGVVVLISIAIAAGVVFLLALIGILWTLFSRKDDKLPPYDAGEPEDDDESTRQRPSSLLEHINAATRAAVLRDHSTSMHSHEKDEDPFRAATATENDPFGPDDSDFARAVTPSDAIYGGAAHEGTSRPAYARYSFDGKGEGELALVSGQEVEVLEDRDPAWWYARDMRTGREGVVPAAYLY